MENILETKYFDHVFENSNCVLKKLLHGTHKVDMQIPDKMNFIDKELILMIGGSMKKSPI